MGGLGADRGSAGTWRAQRDRGSAGTWRAQRDRGSAQHCRSLGAPAVPVLGAPSTYSAAGIGLSAETSGALVFFSRSLFDADSRMLSRDSGRLPITNRSHQRKVTARM